MQFTLPSPKRYFPVSKNDFAFIAGLKPTNPHNSILQFDDQYLNYHHEKKRNRKLSLHRFVQESSLQPKLRKFTFHFILQQIQLNWPGIFSIETCSNNLLIFNKLTHDKLRFDNETFDLIEPNTSINELDAIMSQIQEDLSIVELNSDADRICYLHLNFPNFWSAEDKIGQSFLGAHENVPAMEKMKKSHHAINQMLCQQGPFERFTWGLSASKELNQHPKHVTSSNRCFRKTIDQKDLSQIFLRVERQVTVPLPEFNAYLFFIRTYFENLTDASLEELQHLRHSLKTMSDDIARYKGIYTQRKDLIELINSLP